MNNIPSTEGNSFFSKLKAFFKKIFRRNNKLELPQESNIVEYNRIEKQTEEKNEFENSLQKEIRDHNNKESIIEMVEKNPEIMETLPLERLVQLDKMYDEKIIEARSELEGLKRKLNNI